MLKLGMEEYLELKMYYNNNNNNVFFLTIILNKHFN